jgi:hypothetical protein
MQTSPFPESVRATLWSYDTSKLDLVHDKTRIILQTLNNGSEDAVRWLMRTYTTNDLRDTIRASSEGEWSKKSLNFWSLMLDTTPARTGRFP